MQIKKVEVAELSIHIIEIREKPCKDCVPVETLQRLWTNIE